jgi:RNA polymerase sigma-54 factor
MSMLQRHSQVQRLQQKADPQLLMTNRILQMSALELQQCLAQEISDNPALDAPEEASCNNCAVPGPGCAACPYQLSRLGPGKDSPRASALGAADREVDPLDFVESPQTLQDYLLAQLRAAARGEQVRIGAYLIANIDSDGYLRCATSEAARALLCTEEEVELALGLIQTFDPTGVGARSLQECLLIQARTLAAEGRAPREVAVVIGELWKELAAGKWRAIARVLKLSLPEVERLVVWLRKNLSPYPGSAYRPSWDKSSHRSAQAVRPDVVVRADDEGELTLEVVGEELPGIQVNHEYARLWQEMRERPEAYSEAERRHVRDYMVRAQMFLKSLQDRSSILERLATRLLEEQEVYFRTEREEDLLPITQSQLASFLQVHESTVSRAVAEKFLQLPSGRVVPLSFFFDRALSVRKLVANVVASEDPRTPYSDQEISDILRSQGVVLARRTVMKYREEMNILSSRQRARVSN